MKRKFEVRDDPIDNFVIFDKGLCKKQSSQDDADGKSLPWQEREFKKQTNPKKNDSKTSYRLERLAMSEALF